MENMENKDYINKMYDSSLNTQKEQLKQDYDQGMSDLDAQKEAAQKQTDANLTRTYVEAAKAQKNYNEVQNAYGLSNGAMAQARLAQDNQLQADLTALRAQQQSVDAEAERQRVLLSQQYTAAIRQAQAENDMQKAQALYQEAKDADAQLLQKQKEAAALMANAGDYSLYAKIYGLTPEQLQKLQGEKAEAYNWGDGYGNGGGDDIQRRAETAHAAAAGIVSGINNSSAPNWFEKAVSNMSKRSQNER